MSTQMFSFIPTAADRSRANSFFARRMTLAQTRAVTLFLRSAAHDRLTVTRARALNELSQRTIEAIDRACDHLWHVGHSRRAESLERLRYEIEDHRDTFIRECGRGRVSA